ncbi:predicted protein [Scheffersomyces stipitis CBS 6054]|uniref:Uncharacterized protein n=1 Tax=Scheffersomyces stipitis (strain ATCC 58785 / CBS 6054 / NBRC 10063 / NRRL Y-11545) TaxID=322104 RepID=A3LTM7_PICST|nr:predicted protein [Scheffersomyces stipitis CBS 6054]ABN66441.1 predicted protein [Scheffersomyces stipitis CBS 6054]KAG2733356.1 hypothetical protein G9P44_004346 [Scheffersomyces stipitis]
MSNTISISEVPNVIANLVPMHIQYSGPAKTNEYFTPSKTQEDGNTNAYFRGCKLVGTEITLKNHTGYIINKSETLVHDPEMADDGSGDNIKTVSTYSPTAKFETITIYGHDVPADKYNQWRLINEQQDVADILHTD